MTMKFEVNGKEYQLQGELDSQTTIVSCKAMSTLLRKEKVVVMVQVSP